MYKLLLCWRYLRTRYLALVCIVSVMLGVATLIVVNSVMAGFSTKLRDRLHGCCPTSSSSRPTTLACPTPKARCASSARTRSGRADRGHDADHGNLRHAPFHPERHAVHAAVRLVGIDPEGRAAFGGFKEHLVDPTDQQRPSFDLDGKALDYYDMERQQPGAGRRPFSRSSTRTAMPLPDPPPSPPVASPRRRHRRLRHRPLPRSEVPPAAAPSRHPRSSTRAMTSSSPPSGRRTWRPSATASSSSIISSPK